MGLTMLNDERINELWLSSTNQTFDWMQAFACAVAREARREALEEATVACEIQAIDWRESGAWESSHAADDCAAAIRALIEKEGA